MRPHVELIQETDLCWHAAELLRGQGKARQKNLSYDEENGADSTRVESDTAGHRPGGYHRADTEWYVMAGEVRVGRQAPLIAGIPVRSRTAGECALDGW